MICSLVGGFWPALVAAVVGQPAAQLLLRPAAAHRSPSREPENLLALVVFVLIAVAGVPGGRPGRPAQRRGGPVQRRGRDAVDPGRQPAAWRAGAAGPAGAGARDVRGDQRDAAAPASSAGERAGAGQLGSVVDLASAWATRARDRRTPTPRCRSATTWCWCCAGGALAAEDQRMLAAFATEVAVAYQQRRLAEAAGAAPRAGRDRPGPDRAAQRGQPRPAHPDRLGEGGGVEPAQHRGRLERGRPAAAARRAPTSALDRLTALVTNLLDLSRLQAGALSVTCQPVGVDDVVNRALA